MKEHVVIALFAQLLDPFTCSDKRYTQRYVTEIRLIQPKKEVFVFRKKKVEESDDWMVLLRFFEFNPKKVKTCYHCNSRPLPAFTNSSLLQPYSNN